MSSTSIRNPLLPWFMLLLVACSTPTLNSRTPTYPDSTPVAVVTSLATSRVTSTPDLNALVTAGVATYSAEQTQYAIIQATLRPQPTSTSYQTRATEPTLPIATQNAISTIMSFPRGCKSPEDSELSPDGKWVVFVCLGEEPGEHTMTKIEAINGEVEKEQAYHHLAILDLRTGENILLSLGMTKKESTHEIALSIHYRRSVTSRSPSRIEQSDS